MKKLKLSDDEKYMIKHLGYTQDAVGNLIPPPEVVADMEKAQKEQYEKMRAIQKEKGDPTVFMIDQRCRTMAKHILDYMCGKDDAHEPGKYSYPRSTYQKNLAALLKTAISTGELMPDSWRIYAMARHFDDITFALMEDIDSSRHIQGQDEFLTWWKKNHKKVMAT